MELVDSSAPAAPAAPEPSPAEPAAPTETATEATESPEAPAVELFDLPDGRKVDATTLQREWRENFMPDYTRKSQALAEAARVQNPNLNSPDTPKWKDPNYVPQSYAELIEAGKQAALEEIKSDAQAQEQARMQVVSQVDNEIASIKAKDPKLDENALFVHANKYGFNNLIAAHENMSAMRKVALETEQRVLKNVNARKNDPIAGASAPGTPGAGQAYGANGQYGSAVEYFRRRGQ